MKKNTIVLLSFLFILNACTTTSPEGARVRPMGGGTGGGGYQQTPPQNTNALPQGVPLNDGGPQSNEVGFLNQNTQTSSPQNSNIVFPSATDGTQPQTQQPNYPVAQQGGSSTIQAPNTTSGTPVQSTQSQQSTTASATPAPAPSNNAVKSLLNDARKSVQEGNLSKAAGSLDRAVIIEPNNASIWYDLAQIRLHQGQHSNAERLANKSIGFARGNTELIKRNWAIIAAAREAQGNKAGAEEARNRSR